MTELEIILNALKNCNVKINYFNGVEATCWHHLKDKKVCYVNYSRSKDFDGYVITLASNC